MPSKKLRILKAMRSQWAATIALLLTTVPGAVYSQQPAKKPNILVIMGDDIGWFNASCYNHGMMGYQTPNIDRIAAEGGLFNCWYGQQSCTAGRAAFVTGQSPIRTGLTKVGLPGADIGLRAEDSKRGGATQAAWLCDRAVRQESFGRQG